MEFGVVIALVVFYGVPAFFIAIAVCYLVSFLWNEVMLAYLNLKAWMRKRKRRKRKRR